MERNRNNHPEIQLAKANKTLTAANNTTIERFGTVIFNLTPEQTSNSRNKLQQNLNIYFYITQCNHNILGTPFFKEYIETINVNTNKITINTNTIIDNDITFFTNSTKGYPYYSRLYPIFNREPIYFEENQHKCITFPIPIFKEMETSSGKQLINHSTFLKDKQTPKLIIHRYKRSVTRKRTLYRHIFSNQQKST